MPRSAEEHFPAWEVREKSELNVDPLEEELAGSRRGRRSSVLATEATVETAFDWEKQKFSDDPVEDEGPPSRVNTAFDRDGGGAGIVPQRFSVEPTTARQRRDPAQLALGQTALAAGVAARGLELPEAWRPAPPTTPRPVRARGSLEAGEPSEGLPPEEGSSESLSARLAALGALAPEAAAFGLQPAGRPTFDLHIDDLLREAAERKASDLHLSEGLPPMFRVDGRLVKTEYAPLTDREIQRLVYDVLNDTQIQTFEKEWELDFSYGLADVGRFRFNVYRQRGAIGAAMRSIPTRIPTIEELRLPPILRELTRRPSGLVLVTGATGAGKSTTLAAMIHVINQERDCHIVTIEDPIEYLHTHGRAMIHQRELGADTHSFRNALRAVLREDPDVILIGEMRDLETIAAALTLAETGHLVFATLHTRNAPQTIDRIVDVFPPHQQDQIKVQLANSLEAVLAQTLLPRIGGGRIAATEIMIANSAVRALIREGKTAQLYSCIETGAQQGMQTMDRTLVEMYRMGLISQEAALSASLDRDNLMRLLKTR